MAEYTIDKLEKRIYGNQPTDGAHGQYNYGRVDSGDNITILGKNKNSVINEESDLYTYVINRKDINLQNYPTGVLWQTRGSKLQVTSCIIHNIEAIYSYKNKYPNTKIAFYIYDSVTPDGVKVKEVIDSIDKNGYHLREIIGEGNSFGTSPNCIGYGDLGAVAERTGLGDIITKYSGSFGDVSIGDFPRFTKSSHDSFENNFDVDHFSNGVVGKITGSAYYLIVRIGSDEWEKIPGFRRKVDEIDRNYFIYTINKTELFKMWANKDTTTITLSPTATKNTTDDYGDTEGYSTSGAWGSDNKRNPLFGVNSITIKINAPTWNPVISNKPIVEGGINGNWVDKGVPGWHCVKTIGLNPNNGIDFIGFPEDFYYPVTNDTPDEINGNINYFSGSMITDFRPISFISSSFDVDCQSYYSDETDSGFQFNNLISAPAEFKLGFELGEKDNNVESSKITYFSEGDRQFNYYFFVINWDWKDGEKGGGECELTDTCLEEVGQQFPVSIDELYGLNLEPADLYDRKTINELATHQYIEPGIKIIKAVVFSTINNIVSGYESYVQATNWKLVTLTINITEDRAIVSDFADVGGDDFVYLPYPNTVKLDKTIHFTGEQTDTTYKSSHVVISGLSEDSVYVTNLKKILKKDGFGRAEISEKIDAKKSFENTPKGKLNEYGDFLGKSDVSQVRYFNNGSYDMKTLLGISTDIVVGNNYYPHSSSSYWDGNINTFPKESPAGDIFISEYNQFKENCLFELNLSELDGKTVKDTSGNGNKGILIGDFSVKKDKIGKKSTRDSYIKVSKLGRKNGAF